MGQHPETLGINYYTWRNVIAKECLDEKSKDDDFDAAINPEPIPPLTKNRYQDQNFIQVVQPLQVFRPLTLAGGPKAVMQKNGFFKTVVDPVEQGLKGIVFTAARKGLKVKAVGSGHSFSDVATTSDYLVVTDDLNEMLTRKKDTESPAIRHALFLKNDIRTKGYPAFIKTHFKAGDSSRKFYGDPEEKPGLAEFEAGIKIASLNEQLWDLEWSLYNMGTYQGQSFIGAASTATHGSGHTLPPLPDMIRSMVIVADRGMVLRIEPSIGITQPGALAGEGDFEPPVADGFKALIGKRIFKTNEPNVDFLIQDDDWFAASLVNVGTFGIVYSVIIEVIPRYFLLETVEYTTWKELRPRLLRQTGSLQQPDQISLGFPEGPELFVHKEFVGRFPADKGLECDDTIPHAQITVSQIRQTTIEIHPHKIEDGAHRGQNICRIMRQYRVPYSDFAKRWSKKEKGRISDPFQDLFVIQTTKDALNEAWENVQHNEDEQLEWYKKNAALTAVALLRPVSGKFFENIEALMQQKGRIAEVLNNAPIEPGCREHYLNRNYNTQFIPLFPGYGVELGFTTRRLKEFDNLPGYIAAMDRILELAQQHWELGRYMQSSPLALRMVKASNAYFAMQYSDSNEPTCMIELLNQSDTHGGKELLYRYQRELFKYGARPHWGLDLSVTTGNNGLMYDMYPKFDKWFEVYKTLNRTGTFNNRFTDRIGLSGQPFR